MDTLESDDGALHTLFQAVPLDGIEHLLLELRQLAAVRGVPSELQRARAQALADDPAFGQRDHPIIRRILEA